MNKTILRSKPFSFRSGYPVSSELVNQAFDNLYYDLCNILGTELPDLTSGEFKDYIDAIKMNSEQININLMGHEKDLQSDAGGYTKDWRRV